MRNLNFAMPHWGTVSQILWLQKNLKQRSTAKLLSSQKLKARDILQLLILKKADGMLIKCYASTLHKLIKLELEVSVSIDSKNIEDQGGFGLERKYGSKKKMREFQTFCVIFKCLHKWRKQWQSQKMKSRSNSIWRIRRMTSHNWTKNFQNAEEKHHTIARWLRVSCDFYL